MRTRPLDETTQPIPGNVIFLCTLQGTELIPLHSAIILRVLDNETYILHAAAGSRRINRNGVVIDQLNRYKNKWDNVGIHLTELSCWSTQFTAHYRQAILETTSLFPMTYVQQLAKTKLKIWRRTPLEFAEDPTQLRECKQFKMTIPFCDNPNYAELGEIPEEGVNCSLMVALCLHHALLKLFPSTTRPLLFTRSDNSSVLPEIISITSEDHAITDNTKQTHLPCRLMLMPPTSTRYKREPSLLCECNSSTASKRTRVTHSEEIEPTPSNEKVSI